MTTLQCRRARGFCRPTDFAASAPLPDARQIIAILAIFVVCSGGSPHNAKVTAAGPTDTEPKAVMPVWRTEESPELYRAAIELAKEAERLSDDLWNEREKKQLSAAKFAVIAREAGRVRLALVRMKRIAERLIVLGEPSGVELQLRADAIDARLQQVVGAVKALPTIDLKLTTGEQTLIRNIDVQRRQLPAIKKLFDAGKVEAAEEMLFKARDHVEPMTVWFLYSELQTHFDPMDKAESAIGPKVREIRTTRAAAAIDEELKKLLPDFAGLARKIGEEHAAVRAAGKAEVDGERLDGPDVMLAAARRSHAAEASFIRARALLWASLETRTKSRDELSALEVAHEKFATGLGSRLAEYIKGDAERASASDVRLLYMRYLKSSAQSLIGVDDPKAVDLVNKALDSLLSKSPELAGEVVSYRAATNDLLRWRARTAAALARAKTAQARTLAERFAAALSEIEGDKALSLERSANTATLEKPASLAMVSLAKSLVSQPVIVAKVSLAGRSYESKAEGGTFSTMKTGEDLALQITRLKSDLLLQEIPSPLTLDAAFALESAEAGYLDAAGGTVEHVELVGAINHWAASRDEPPGSGAGPAASITVPASPLRHVLLQAHLAPRWLQHRYIFVDFP